MTPYELGIALGEFDWDSNIYFDKEITCSEDKSDADLLKEEEKARSYQVANM